MTAEGKGSEALARGEQARRDKLPADAKAAFAEAVQICRDAGAEKDLAHALTRRARIERDVHDFESARRDQEEALAICRRIGDTDALPGVARHLADIFVDLKHYDAATPLYAETLALYNARNDVPPLEMANVIRSIAVHAELRGDTAEARRLWTDARDRYAKLDDVFLKLTGTRENPGVREADIRLARLKG